MPGYGDGEEGSNRPNTRHFFPSLPAVSSPQLFVRALFDYDPGQDPAVPCKEAAVAFGWGDVLQVVSAEDDAWWQARPQRDGQSRAGLVPSPQLHERWATLSAAPRNVSEESPRLLSLSETGELRCSDPKPSSSLAESNRQVTRPNFSLLLGGGQVSFEGGGQRPPLHSRLLYSLHMRHR